MLSLGLLAWTAADADVQTVKLTTQRTVGETVSFEVSAMTGVTVDWGDGDAVSYPDGEVTGVLKAATFTVKGDEFLTSLLVPGLDLTELDVTEANQLLTLDCSNNHLKQLGLSRASFLRELDCSNNEIEELGLINCVQLRTLNCASNKLTSITLTRTTNLEQLICDNNMTRKDYINVSTLIRQPLDYAVELEIIDANPMRKVKIEPRMFKQDRKKSSETHVFTRDEVAALSLAAWEDLENERLVYKLCPLAFLFMFQTGLRIGEACTVRYEDIEDGELHLQRSVERDPHKVKEGLKGNCAERWVTLSSEALSIIDEAKRRQIDAGVNADGYIFSLTEKHLSYRALSECFRRYCERAGISYRSSHKARKTFISTLLDGGVNLNTVREWAGHKDEHTIFNSYYYDRRTSDEKREILDDALSVL